MAKERLSMRKIREILRLKYECHLTDRQIAKSCLVARSTVANYLSKAKSAGLKWPIPGNLSDTDIWVKIENPLLRSGIALAYAGPGNKRADGGVLQKYPVRQISADFEINRCQALRPR